MTGSRPHPARRSEAGATLVIVLVFLIASGTLLAALLGYTATSTRSSRNFRAKSDVTTRAHNAIAVTIQGMRPDLAQGRYGTGTNTVAGTLDGVAVTCSGEPANSDGPASGNPTGSGSYDDRRLSCTASIDGRSVMDARVVLHDGGGDAPGSYLEVLSISRTG